jgi:hypothetical protein
LSFKLLLLGHFPLFPSLNEVGQKFNNYHKVRLYRAITLICNRVINTTELKSFRYTGEKNPTKMHSGCFGIMGGHGNFAFNLVIKLSVELGYVFLSQVHYNLFVQ